VTTAEIAAGEAGADVLARIVRRRRERLAEAAAVAGPTPELPAGPPRTAADNAFLAALAGRGHRAAIVAEVKMGSPRLGSLAGRVDPLRQAEIYAENGAAALSVVVEPDFFSGSYELLAACRRAAGLPAVAKDFVVDPRQLVWAREAGADAVLLVASLYAADDLARYAGMARGLGLAPLVETHDEADVAKLGAGAWEVVGVNNRDLKTFEVDLERSIALLPRLPAGALRVAESGIGSRAAVERLVRAGFDAFLVGESLLLAGDPAAKLRELAG
jgi:indole-3-glycerol phosphate synthase